MELPREDSLNADPPAALHHLRGWAAQFYDDASPAPVTDVLVVFAFLVGVEMGWTQPDSAAALLEHVDDKMPSAGEQARALVVRLAGLPARGASHITLAKQRPTRRAAWASPLSAIFKLGHPRRP